MNASIAQTRFDKTRSADRMKVQHPIRMIAVIPGTREGPGYMFIHRQLRSLERLGVEVERFFLRSRTSLIEVCREWWELRREVKRVQPDFIHAEYGTMTSGIPALVFSVPLLVTFRGSDLNPHPSLSWFRRWLGFLISQLSALRAKHVICVSSQLKSRLWCRKSKVTTLLDGVDLDLFCPMTRTKARELLGWNQAEKVVLFCAGGEAYAKGIDMVQAAFKLVAQEIRNSRLVILDGTVPPQEIPAYLNASDCLAFASLNEGSPNIVKESLACNLPVISVDVGDVRERIASVNACKIVDRNPADLADGMVDVLRKGARSDGRKAVMDLSEQAVAVELLSLYHEVVTSSRAKSFTPEMRTH